MLLLVWVSFVFTLSVLVFASVFDFRKRMISNWVWVFSYPVGCVMTLFGVVFGVFELGVVLVSVGVSVVLGLVLFFVGFCGGADVKTLLFIGLTLPVSPHTAAAPVIPLILTVFLNTAVLSLVWPLSVFVLNLKDALRGHCLFEERVSLKKKLWLLFTTRRVSLEKLGLKYLPVETVEIWEGKPVRRLLRFVRAETDFSKHLKILKEHRELYKNGVLASPTIPSICFFTLALTTAALWGNLLFPAATFLVFRC